MAAILYFRRNLQTPHQQAGLLCQCQVGILALKPVSLAHLRLAIRFTVAASQNEDIFSTLKGFSSALTSYSTDTTGKGQADFQNKLNNVISNMNNALTSVLGTNASAGSWQNEVTAVQTVNTNISLNYSQTLSGLQDLDYASAISSFSQNQTLLEAARQTYSKIQGLSLFQYIS